MSLSSLFKNISKFTQDNSPAILMGVAVSGTLITAYLTGKATLKASEVLKDESQFLEPKEKVALVWKFYIPPAICAASTIACIIGGSYIANNRALALTATYAISERAFDEYQNKMKEKFGERKEREARDELAQDRVRRDGEKSQGLVFVGTGSVLCHEAFTGRFFLSSVEELKKAQNDTNYQIMHDNYAALSDFYYRVGLPTTSYSDEVGWNLDDQLELEFSGTITEDGRPCISINYQVMPIRGYSRLS